MTTSPVFVGWVALRLVLRKTAERSLFREERGLASRVPSVSETISLRKYPIGNTKQKNTSRVTNYGEGLVNRPAKVKNKDPARSSYSFTELHQNAKLEYEPNLPAIANCKHSRWQFHPLLSATNWIEFHFGSKTVVFRVIDMKYELRIQLAEP